MTRTTSARASAAERAAAGVAFLDEHDPSWWRENVPNAIDVDRLEMADPSACILGQRCPLEALTAYWARWGSLATDVMTGEEPYEAYAEHLSGLAADSDDIWRWAGMHGFNTSISDPCWFTDLTAEWRRVILARRAQS